MTKAAAFFDLDRTLISGASVFPLGVAAWFEQSWKGSFV